MAQYYDGTKLLSLKDIDGNKPEIYICTTNRTGGKTTYFGRLLINRFKEKGEKFMLIYRFEYELSDCADKFFKDIGALFFPNDTMISESKGKGKYHDLYLNDIHCGYAISLNSADSIKKNSHLFSDTKYMLFDEFQSETNHYCNDEITKFISVHTSVARGKGEQIRYVPVYMLSNPVSLINPYYVALGISGRLNKETKFLRGKGFVMEQGYVQSASERQKHSGFNKAFSNEQYIAYSTENVYLNDKTSFIEKIDGNSRYLMTLRYNDTDYSIKAYDNLGIIYCDTSVDSSFPIKISVTTSDHQINYVMLKRNDIYLQELRWYFEQGVFRFKDLRCKEAVLNALSYKML